MRRDGLPKRRIPNWKKKRTQRKERMFSSPLEQFDLIRLLGFYWRGLDLSLFTMILPLALLLLGLYLVLTLLSSTIALVPSSWHSSLEALYAFLWILVKEQTGDRGLPFFPFFLTLFLALLTTNLLSLMPFGIAITSHVVLTLFLSFTLILTLFLLGFVEQDWKFLRLFVPNCPFPLLFLLVPIELFSYFVRCFSLAIRLSANILAGHTLVVIVSGFVLKLAQLRLWLLFPLLSLLLMLFALEFGVAFLQAYVFTILLAIYLRDSLYLADH
jgi:F-type H+-transporting ATPase subunit a